MLAPNKKSAPTNRNTELSARLKVAEEQLRLLREENQRLQALEQAHEQLKSELSQKSERTVLLEEELRYLPTTVRGLYFYLYLFTDVFSRKIVAWQIYAEESSANASEVLKDLCRREQIAPGQLLLHSDNGSSMKGATISQRCRP